MRPEITPQQYIALIRSRFSKAGDPEVAEGQMRYMRNQYAFYGLKAPQWVPMIKAINKEYGMYDGKDLKTFARLCFEEEHHEMFYCGLQMIEKQIKKQPADFISFLEKAIIKGNWWDTVDWVNKLVGIHFLRYPELQRPYCEKWIASKNIWLQRVAIIHQLMYKDKTNAKLLFEMISYRKDSNEFFVQKGSGWALRQYARVDPQAVMKYVRANPDLSSLTKREATKRIM